MSNTDQNWLDLSNRPQEHNWRFYNDTFFQPCKEIGRWYFSAQTAYRYQSFPPSQKEVPSSCQRPPIPWALCLILWLPPAQALSPTMPSLVVCSPSSLSTYVHIVFMGFLFVCLFVCLIFDLYFFKYCPNPLILFTTKFLETNFLSPSSHIPFKSQFASSLASSLFTENDFCKSPKTKTIEHFFGLYFPWSLGCIWPNWPSTP